MRHVSAFFSRGDASPAARGYHPPAASTFFISPRSDLLLPPLSLKSTFSLFLFFSFGFSLLLDDLSCTFASLSNCLCLFVRFVPSIFPGLSLSPVFISYFVPCPLSLLLISSPVFIHRFVLCLHSPIPPNRKNIRLAHYKTMAHVLALCLRHHLI